LDLAKGHSARADDRTDELNQLNRSIFRPVITFNKDAKRAAQEAKVQARYEDERSSREKAALDIRESQNRLGQAQTYGREEDRDELVGGGRGRFRSEGQLAARKEQRKRFQFESTASDDEVEDEIDDNLDEIGDATRRLKALGMAMGQELDKQNQRIDLIDQKTVNLDGKIVRNTERVSNDPALVALTSVDYSLTFLAQESQVGSRRLLGVFSIGNIYLVITICYAFNLIDLSPTLPIPLPPQNGPGISQLN
jgi:hypothetical protein